MNQDYFEAYNKPITWDWLITLGFSHREGITPKQLDLEVASAYLEVYPTYTNRDDCLRFFISDKHRRSEYVMYPPRNQGEMWEFLARLDYEPALQRRQLQQKKP